jgi:CheY-like chemotaxis protein
MSSEDRPIDSGDPGDRDRELEQARDKAERASHAKSRFLAMVSHEIRTPLNGILGMAHLLERTPLTPEQENYITAVRRSGTALLHLVEDLLDFSTIEADRFQLRPGPLDPRQFIEETVELMASRAHEKGIDIASEISPDVPGRISADANRLRQVLLNLVGNAIKFTDQGGILVSLAPSGSGEIELSVSDTGPGLAQKDQQRIFAEFEQADMETTRRHGGVGLGLTISTRIVSAMGGRLTVESELGRGSRFIATLPVEAIEEIRPAIGTPQPLAGVRVLLIAPDGQTAAALARSVLEEGGRLDHHADASFVLEEGRDRSESYSHVVIDQRLMPLAGGAGVLQALLDHAPRRILLVRPMERAALDTLYESGFDGWLVAPVRRSSLVSVLLKDRLETPQQSPTTEARRVVRMPSFARSLRILLAEDNPVNAMLMTAMLKEFGHQVVLVEDGRKLVAAARDRTREQTPIDLAITDLSMPHMDGAMAVGRIREHERASGLPRLPVVILSAESGAETRDRLLNAGADAYLEKPVDPEMLATTIRMLSADR